MFCGLVVDVSIVAMNTFEEFDELYVIKEMRNRAEIIRVFEDESQHLPLKEGIMTPASQLG
jgi:hypothetical protein